jgi:hypothetical protein
MPYFAPEVVEGKPYDCKCDVFSFAILAWEIFSLKPAFKGMTKAAFLHRVTRNKERLPLPKTLRPSTKHMLKEAWDHEPTKRPDMTRVASIIHGDLNDISDGDEAILKRSKHMMNLSHRSMLMGQQGGTRKSSHG